MLVVRKAQVDELENDVVARFTDAVAAHVESIFSRPPDAAAETRRIVELGLLRARSYGFCAAGDVIHFVYLLFIAGPAFDAEPMMAAVLASVTDSPRARLCKAFQLLPNQERGV